jgi:hypothetical protein
MPSYQDNARNFGTLVLLSVAFERVRIISTAKNNGGNSLRLISHEGWLVRAISLQSIAGLFSLYSIRDPKKS